jgi:hypothetical protein
MSSGRLNLSIRGREDVPISGRPQYSYYLKKYARQESFEYLFVDNSLETIVQGRTPTYGDTISFRVPQRGDLLNKVFLKIVLPPSYLYSNLIRNKTDTFNLYSIIEHVEILIGGQLIQRLTGEYILNYINLYHSSNDLEFFRNTSEMKIRDLKKTYASFGQFVLLPIPFYFSEMPGHEIPLLALTRQNVNINIKLAPRPPITDIPELSDVTVSTEYIILGNEKTRQILQSQGLMYRVTQIQMNSEVIHRTELKKVIDLDFQNPVREMFVCIQPQTYQDITNAKFYNFFGNYRNSFLNFRNEQTGWYLSEHHLKGMSLRFNNNEYINEESSGSAIMMSSTLPQKYYANSDNIQRFKGYAYPFVIDPLAKYPQGHINMSRIIKKELTLHMNPSSFTRNVRIYASSYNILMIKDGVAGLMFANPSHYNPKIVLGESVEVTEGNPPTITETLSEDQGFYYAIKISDGLDIVGIQLYTEGNPQFSSPQDLHDDQFSYLLNTTDTFMSNATPTNKNEYVPGTVGQVLRSVIEVPNENDPIKSELYDIGTTKNYIYTSNFGFVKRLRLAIKTHEITSGGNLNTVITDDDFSELEQTAEITLYRSSNFFDLEDIDGWISTAKADTRLIRVNHIRGGESDAYYYAAHALTDENNNITEYSNVYFARTYDFEYALSIVAPRTDNYNPDVNDAVSSVSFKVTNLSGSGTVKVTYGTSERISATPFNRGDTEIDLQFDEDLERGVKVYTVEIFVQGEGTTTKAFSIVSGGRAPPLYHAIQVLRPEGQTGTMSLRILQAYSPPPDITQFTNSGIIEETASQQLTITNLAHSGGTTLYSNHISNCNYSVHLRYGKTQRNGPLVLSESNSDVNDETVPEVSLFTLGPTEYLYTTSPVSITFYTIGVVSGSGLNLDENSRVKLYSSTEPFGVPSISEWVAGTTNREFILSDLNKNASKKTYMTVRVKYNDNPPPKNTANFATDYSRSYHINSYYIPFDVVAPVMTITYQGNIVHSSNIEVERFTPISAFVNYLEDFTYINVQKDDQSAIVVETNNWSNTVVGFYQMTFTATDPFFNSSTQTINIDLVDTRGPRVTSSTFTGSGLGVTIFFTIDETATGSLFENNVEIHQFTTPSQTFSFAVTGLTEGQNYVYKAIMTDDYGNISTVLLGDYTADITPPILTIEYDGVQQYDNDNIYVERYSTLGTFSNSVSDNVDTELTVVETGDVLDLDINAPGTTLLKRFTVTDTGGNSNVVNLYIDIIDTITPEIIVFNAGTRIFDGDSVTMERLTPKEDFIDNVLGLTASTNELYALVTTDSTAFQNTTTSPYSVVFTANDGPNSNVATITVNVADTTPISLINKTFLAFRRDVLFHADMTEIGTVQILRDGTVINTWNQVTYFSETFTNLPEGPPGNVWSVNTIDNFGQVAAYTMGAHTSDGTPPELFLFDQNGNRVGHGDTVFHERATDFVELTNSAIDAVDNQRTVVITGASPPTSITSVGITIQRTYTATDRQNNSNVATVTFEVRDTVAPSVTLSSVVPSSSTNSIIISATLSEPATVILKRGTTNIYQPTGTPSSISFVDQNLQEGATFTYNLFAIDPSNNSDTIVLGTATVGDFTAPIINILNYQNSLVNPNGSIYIERYSTFTEISLVDRANDNVDGAMDITSLSGPPDTSARHGTITSRQFRAIDDTGNSNTVTINFVIQDTVTPTFLSTPEVVYNGSRINFTGTMSEECDVHVKNAFGGTILATDTTNQNSPYNFDVSTTNLTQSFYYLQANDGANDSASSSSLTYETFLGLTFQSNVFFDRYGNTTQVDFEYSDLDFKGESSMTVELSTNSNFTGIIDTTTISSGTTSHRTTLFPVVSSWGGKTYYTRVQPTGRIQTLLSSSFVGGVKPNTSSQQHTMYMSTTNTVDIYYLELPFNNWSKPSNWFNGNVGSDYNDNHDDFDSWRNGPFDTSANRYVKVGPGTNMPAFNFYFSPVNYTNHNLILWTRRSSDETRISSLTARYNNNVVITYQHSSKRVEYGNNAGKTGNNSSRWVHTWTVASVDYVNAATS